MSESLAGAAPRVDRAAHYPSLLLALAFGIAFLARTSVGYLTPFIAHDIAMPYARMGLLSAAFGLTWALSGYWVGRFTDRFPLRTLLVAAVLILIASSATSGLAPTFAVLCLARLASGLGGGPMMPLVQTSAASLGGDHRGLRMGTIQGGGDIISGIAGPVLLVPIAAHWGWRAALLMIAAIAAICALMLAKWLPPLSPQRHRGRQAASGNKRRLERARDGPEASNVRLCGLVGAAMIAWLMLGLTFYPAYLIDVQHRGTEQMGLLMSFSAAASLAATFLVPYISDRLGRRRVLIAFVAVGALSPLAVWLGGRCLPLEAAGLCLGSLAGGTFPLFLAVIPSESLSQWRLTAGIGWVQAVGEICGGVAAPALAGWLSDRAGPGVPLVMALAAALMATLFATKMQEPQRRGDTAPSPRSFMRSALGSRPQEL